MESALAQNAAANRSAAWFTVAAPADATPELYHVYV